MSADAVIEQRLAAVERAVAEIRQRLAVQTSAGDWLERITGSMANEPAFDEVLALGRAIREADRPADEPGEGS